MDDRPRRRPLRLEGYDYSRDGAYFVTVCTAGRRNLFWEDAAVGAGPRPARPPLNAYGELVAQIWAALPDHIPNLILEQFVVMPNHIHGLLRIEGDRAGLEPAPTVPLGEIVRQLKTFSARQINQIRGTPGAAVWQRGYHDHIVRDEDDFLRIWSYIEENPLKWELDRYYRPE